ncbi:alpha-1,2-fucosyltransferase [Vibrio sp. RC27]
MIFFIGKGGLGNQIFQYVFLKKIQKKNEKLFVFGFEELTTVFDVGDIVNFNKNNRWVRFVVNKLVVNILYFLSEMKIISSIKINKDSVSGCYLREVNDYSETVGFINQITYIYPGYFQGESFFYKKDAKNLKIRNNYIRESKEFLNKVPEESHKVFVHIRQGDYKTYRVLGKSALLPFSYFKSRIQWFQKNKPNVFFIFLSDEPGFIEKEFSFIENKLISENAYMGTDLALMTLCDSAILCPSTFGWWGAYLMEQQNTIFVPKYWLGFNSKIEYPFGIIPKGAYEVEM